MCERGWGIAEAQKLKMVGAVEVDPSPTATGLLFKSKFRLTLIARVFKLGIRETEKYKIGPTDFQFNLFTRLEVVHVFLSPLLGFL